MRHHGLLLPLLPILAVLLLLADRGAGAEAEVFTLGTHGRTAIVWRRAGLGKPGLARWDGADWVPLEIPVDCRRYGHTTLERELVWVGDLPSGDVRLRADPGVKTKDIATRPAAPGEKTRERLLEHGKPLYGLAIAAYTVGRQDGPALCLLADNGTEEEIVRPFRSGTLTLLARCGKLRIEKEVKVIPGMREVSLRPGGRFGDGPLHAFTFALGPREVRITFPKPGDWEFRYRFTQPKDEATRKEGAWAGTVESNPVVIRVEGWIDAKAAEKLGAGADPVEVPEAEDTAAPAPRAGTYVTGAWQYVVEIRAPGTRSEGISANLWFRDRLVVPGKTGERIRTPYGVMEYRGRTPKPQGLLGYWPAGEFWGSTGWFPVP